MGNVDSAVVRRRKERLISLSVAASEVGDFGDVVDSAGVGGLVSAGAVARVPHCASLSGVQWEIIFSLFKH